VLALHTILFIFALVVALTLTEGDLKSAISEASSNQESSQALSLLGLVICSSFFGGALVISPLLEKLSCSLFLCVYELLFFVASLLYLSIDFSIVIGLIFLTSLYIARTHYTNIRF
jgi:hypothetical protein